MCRVAGSLTLCDPISSSSSSFNFYGKCRPVALRWGSHEEVYRPLPFYLYLDLCLSISTSDYSRHFRCYIFHPCTTVRIFRLCISTSYTLPSFPLMQSPQEVHATVVYQILTCQCAQGLHLRVLPTPVLPTEVFRLASRRVPGCLVLRGVYVSPACNKLLLSPKIHNSLAAAL